MHKKRKHTNITMSDVAQKVGVSQATVSRVLSNHSKINQQTKDTVLNAIREMGYRHVALNAEMMPKPKPMTFGLLMCPLPEQTNPLGLIFLMK